MKRTITDFKPGELVLTPDYDTSPSWREQLCIVTRANRNEAFVYVRRLSDGTAGEWYPTSLRKPEDEES